MPTLSSENITTDFLNITKLSEKEFNLPNIIENARRYVEGRIIPSSLTSPDIARCEYAACAHAVYDYTLQKLLSDRIVISQTGNAVSDYRENSMIEAAYSFRKSVFGSMKDLIRDDSFVFETMEG